MYRYGYLYSNVPPWVMGPSIILAIVGAFVALRGGGRKLVLWL